MENLINDFSFGLFFWQTLLFGVLLILLRKYAWKPILSAINDREQGIEDALEAAENARKEMLNLKSANEEILKEARAEREVLLKDARDIRNKMISDAKEVAQEQAQKMISQAKESITNEKLAAITELKNQVAELSIDIAKKVIQQELSSEDKHLALIEKMLKDVSLK
ncbi:MAG: ATP synthase F0 subunit B [Flavobacteriales bacterium CG_4_9_14_0_2_um_filter_35_242]|nr:F0F1 ATP synthase subunit B [Zetaproteobacteria bacterium]OIO11742.1 MAG: ATP synthase F0 subunit B [Flavobacteriaceae bacterium CG1_02_35_72]PIR13814.1 MAG: ATP synthase F0 subunit B [Flavobacteriales bacterium CG11_big_fil_rev_8_21_14_0_20_35_7]PIV16181.1 MAG: ATP synthase F0 subunit B [Flavobacteriales bacterium CG03_land_8_20_14_0_80_35_15]PIX06288.1 MAG: ATP synthase F0 subunit B [Flavobacteriales bacterium CG_4_8_14_3_um_filter_35_10]PJA06919.1 MAG: ATP synthase F0 subunit B [Flavobac